MMSLVISACLAASPERCELLEIGTSLTEGYKACRIEMQDDVERWKSAHPDQVVQSAYCMVGRSAPQD